MSHADLVAGLRTWLRDVAYTAKLTTTAELLTREHVPEAAPEV